MKRLFWWFLGCSVGALAILWTLFLVGENHDQESWTLWPGILFAFPILLLFALAFVARWKLHSVWARGLCLAAASLICILLFSLPPCQLKEKFRYSPSPPIASNVPKAADVPNRVDIFLMEEHKKVVEEIKLRTDAEDTWFRYKFILVGGLLAAFLTHVVRKGSDEQSQRTPKRKRLSRNRKTYQPVDPPGKLRILTDINLVDGCWILALACIIALTVDIHVRLSTIGTIQLGNWIAYNVEPYFLPTPPDCDSQGKPRTAQSTQSPTPPLPPITSPKGTGCPYPYEQFLRIADRDGKTGAGALHSSELYAFSYWPHVHFLTWVLYILYLFTLQVTCLGAEARLRTDLKASYALVQVAFCAFAWCAHVAPQTFQFQLPLSNRWVWGWWPPVIFLLLGILLSLVNLPYVIWGGSKAANFDEPQAAAKAAGQQA